MAVPFYFFPKPLLFSLHSSVLLEELAAAVADRIHQPHLLRSEMEILVVLVEAHLLLSLHLKRHLLSARILADRFANLQQ